MDNNIKDKDLRLFAAAWCIVFSLLSISKYIKGQFEVHIVLASFAAIFLAVGIVKPTILKPLLWVLKTVLEFVQTAITSGVLILAYYLVLTPIGLIMRLSGKDILDVKLDKNVKTYWKKRDLTVATKETLSRQF